MKLLFFLVIALVVFLIGQTIPLNSYRKVLVFVLRLVQLACLFLVFHGFEYYSSQEKPRHIIYLVDQSESMDESQTEWISRRISSLEDRRPDQLIRSVLAFGGETSVVFPSSSQKLAGPSELKQALGSFDADPDNTDLEGALLAALSSHSHDLKSRVILFSDGRQTRGNVERILKNISRFGIEVYPVAVASSGSSSVSWEQLVSPQVAAQGSSIPLKLIFKNPAGQTKYADARIILGGVPIIQKRLKIEPGWHTFSISVPAAQPGTMRMEAEVSFDGSDAAYKKSAIVEVEGDRKILLVIDKPTELPLLAQALKNRSVSISISRPDEIPTDISELMEYDAVLLMGIAKSAVSIDQVNALESYVSRFGGGLIMVGLGGSLKEEISNPSALDRILPVKFEAKGLQESSRCACMLMLIDRSASMMGPRIAATKRAAVEMVKQLSEEDLVGVLAFDTAPYVVVELQQAKEIRSFLIEKLVRLKSTGGTNILPALKAAQARLAPVQADVKHVILLSDGNTPVNEDAYRRLLDEFAKQKITVSTVGIGSAFVNVEFLSWLARESGGMFYQMKDLNELPRIIARDARDAIGKLPFSEGYFRPITSKHANWNFEVSQWPVLKGYLTATAKNNANVELEIGLADSPDPLLSQWALGRGRISVFTSDADTRWSPEWIRWDDFENVWASILNYVMRPRYSKDVFVWVDESRGIPQIVIEGEFENPSAQLISKDGSSEVSLGLIQETDFRWRAAIANAESDWYQLILEADAREAQKEALPIVRRWVRVGSAERGVEQQGLAPDEQLLRRISQATGGLFNEPDAAFLPPTEPMRIAHPIDRFVLPIVILLLLLEIAIRGRTML